MNKVYIFSGIGWITVGAIIGLAADKIATSHRAEFNQPIVVGAPGTEFPKSSISYQGSGLFRVPGEAPYGTYQIVQGGSNWGCTWTRLNKFDTEDVGAREQAGTVLKNQENKVQIQKGDKALWLQGDCIWRRIN